MAHTQVLLTDTVPHLGAEADIVRVRRGYARNFLIPQGKALELNPAALRRVNHLKARRAEREARELTAAEELASKVAKLDVEFTLETGEGGKAFGSVTPKDIHDRIMALMPGLDLPKHAVEMDRAIKETGTQEVAVRVHPDVVAKVAVRIVAPAKAAEPPSEEETPPVRRAPRKKKAG